MIFYSIKYPTIHFLVLKGLLNLNFISNQIGDSCMEKPLATLWRNYTQNYKPDVAMRVKICSSGLKATTRQHGLTEYWSHRITHCSSPKNYPKVFCWIYRHEGRKLKHELRCHAVLCSKESVANSIAKTLQVIYLTIYILVISFCTNTSINRVFA